MKPIPIRAMVIHPLKTPHKLGDSLVIKFSFRDWPYGRDFPPDNAYVSKTSLDEGDIGLRFGWGTPPAQSDIICVCSAKIRREESGVRATLSLDQKAMVSLRESGGDHLISLLVPRKVSGYVIYHERGHVTQWLIL